MQVAEIELYNILKTKFTETEAQSIVASLEQKITTQFDERKNEFATKEDMFKLREEFKAESSKLEIKMAHHHADTIKWMFIFWIGQLAAFIAIGKYIFHQ